MTESETDAGVGRLTRRYAETRRRIACITGLLDEAESAAFNAAHSLRKLHRGDIEAIR